MQGPTSNEERQSEGAALVSLLKSGDATERETWPQLQTYLSKYEALWRMHVLPLRNPDSIYLREGIDEDFEVFAMNHYTTYRSLARAFEKIRSRSDDLNFAEEIWANLQRAAEVATKANDAFGKLYRECTGKQPQVNTAKLEQLKNDIKQYRNLLHEPMPGTIKDGLGPRLIPHRDMIEKYARWTTAMYRRVDSDFVPVEAQLNGDFNRVCGVLQDLWKQLEAASEQLVKNRDYLRRRSAGKASTTGPSVSNPYAVSGSWFGAQRPAKN